MNEDTNRELRAALLALLPANGSLVTVRQLAAATHTTTRQVTHELVDEWLAGRIDFDLRADGFSARRFGPTPNH